MCDQDTDWENCKENIQPLTTGRKISLFANSLKSEMLTPEETEEYEALKAALENNTGEDELAPYVALLTFMSQHSCLYKRQGMGSVHRRLEIKCVAKFLNDERYRNDDRFVKIYLHSLKNFPLTKRGSLLQSALDSGLGEKNIAMYIAISESFEADSNPREAAAILNAGIANGIQPKRLLEEHLRNLQYRTVEALAKQNKLGSPTRTPYSRDFGHSVPVAPNNEAPSFRTGLSQAPAVAKSKVTETQQQKTIPIYKDENAEPDAQCVQKPVNPVKEIRQMKQEVENEIAPSKWNLAENKLNEELVGRTEKIQIYEDEESFGSATKNYSKSDLPKLALRELKVEEVGDEELTGDTNGVVLPKIENNSGNSSNSSGNSSGVPENTTSNLSSKMAGLKLNESRRLSAATKLADTAMMSRLKPHSQSMSDLKSSKVEENNLKNLSSLSFKSSAAEVELSNGNFKFNPGVKNFLPPPSSNSSKGSENSTLGKNQNVVMGKIKVGRDSESCDSSSSYHSVPSNQPSNSEEEAVTFTEEYGAETGNPMDVCDENKLEPPGGAVFKFSSKKFIVGGKQISFEELRSLSTPACRKDVLNSKNDIQVPAEVSSDVSRYIWKLSRRTICLAEEIRDLKERITELEGNEKVNAQMQATMEALEKRISALEQPPPKTPVGVLTEKERSLLLSPKAQFRFDISVISDNPNPRALFGANDEVKSLYPPEVRRSLSEITHADDSSFRPMMRREDYTEAIFRQQPDVPTDFNDSNITRALHMLPQPQQCSTPEAGETFDFQQMNLPPRRLGFVAPCFDHRSNFNMSMQEAAQNLSTIQETSKESRGSTTGSSSSSTMYTTRGAANFSTSSAIGNNQRWVSGTSTPNYNMHNTHRSPY